MPATEPTLPTEVSTPKPASQTWNRLMRAVVGIFAIATLLWLLHRIGWAKVGNTLVRIGPAGMVILLVLGTAENAFDATSFQLALARRVSALKMLGYSSIGGLVNVLLPWDAGEVIKVSLIRQHVSLTDAITGAVIWNYLCKLSRPLVGIAAALIGLVACPSVPAIVRWSILAASVLSVAPYLLIKWILHRGASTAVVRLLARLHLMRKARATEWVARAQVLDTQVRGYYRNNPRRYWWMLTSQCVARICSWGAMGAAVMFLRLPYGFALVALAYSAVSVATYVYMIIPSRLGVGEVAGAGMFVLLGLPFDAGLLVQLVMRLKGLATLALLALFASRNLGRETRRVPDVRKGGPNHIARASDPTNPE